MTPHRDTAPRGLIVTSLILFAIIALLITRGVDLGRLGLIAVFALGIFAYESFRTTHKASTSLDAGSTGPDASGSSDEVRH